MAYCNSCGDTGMRMVGSSAPCPACRDGVDVYEWHRRVMLWWVHQRRLAWALEWLSWKVYVGVLSAEDEARMLAECLPAGKQMRLL